MFLSAAFRWGCDASVKLARLYSDNSASLCGSNSTQAYADAKSSISSTVRLSGRLFGATMIGLALLSLCVMPMFMFALWKTRRTLTVLLRSVACETEDHAGLTADSLGSAVQVAKHKYSSLQLFIYKTYAMVAIIFVSLAYRALHNGMMGVGFAIGPKPGCDSPCAACQYPSFVLSSIMQFSQAIVVSTGLLDEVFRSSSAHMRQTQSVRNLHVRQHSHGPLGHATA